MTGQLLGVALGMLIRRAIPAMAAPLAVHYVASFHAGFDPGAHRTPTYATRPLDMISVAAELGVVGCMLVR